MILILAPNKPDERYKPYKPNEPDKPYERS